MPELLQNAPSSTGTEADAAPHVIEADDHLARLYVTTAEEPWYSSLIRNIRETIHPPQLPPLQVTSKPVAVKEIWGLYGRDKKSNAMSLAIHVGVVVLLFTVASSKAVQQMAKNVIPLISPDIAPYIPKMAEQKNQMQGGGGGGDRSPTPASKGKLPKPSMKQFTPPMAVINNPNPKLVMDPTIIAPPDTPLPNVNMPAWGDPLAKMGPPSNGPGSGGGIGSGSGGGVWAPVVLSKIDPEYSEEARKAKYSGTVILQLVVDSNGHARDIRVVRSLGLGLDEKAIEAVNKWRFKPGYRNGQ